MEENEVSDRLLSYAFYALSTVTVIASIIVLNVYLLAAALALFALAVFYLRSGHLANNLILRLSRMVEVYNGYTLSGDAKAVVKRVGDHYRGYSLAIMEPNREGETFGSIKAALEKVEDPFEFGLVVKEVDKKALLDSLETKRRMKEITLSRAGQRSYDKINSINRELALIDAEIKSIVSAGRAFDTLIRIKTFADARASHAAAKAATANMERIATVFATTLNMSYSLLSGEALLNSIEAFG